MRFVFTESLGCVWGNDYCRFLFEGTKPLGGGETAILRTAFELAKNGHSVDVYYPGKEDRYLGVDFHPKVNAYSRVLLGDYDVLVSWSDAEAIRMAPAHVRKIFSQQLNDMPVDRNFWKAIDAVVSPSYTHLRFLMNYAPPGASCAWVEMGGGADQERFTNVRPWQDRKHVVVYASSPDRGLHHLLAVWPEVRARVPDAELRLFYNPQRFVDWLNGPRELGFNMDVVTRGKTLNKLISPMPAGARSFGAVSQSELAKHLSECRVLAFPLDPVAATEGFGQTVARALAAGMWVVSRPEDAFPELYQDAVQWIDGGIVDDAWRARFRDALVEALLSESNPYEKAARHVLTDLTWERSARQIERAATLCLGGTMA